MLASRQNDKDIVRANNNLLTSVCVMGIEILAQWRKSFRETNCSPANFLGILKAQVDYLNVEYTAAEVVTHPEFSGRKRIYLRLCYYDFFLDITAILAPTHDLHIVTYLSQKDKWGIGGKVAAETWRFLGKWVDKGNSKMYNTLADFVDPPKKKKPSVFRQQEVNIFCDTIHSIIISIAQQLQEENI